MTVQRALVISFVMCLTLVAQSQVCGDCNGDGVVNVVDALRAAQISASIVLPTPPDYLTCDVDADTDIDILDALRTAQFSAGLPVAVNCVSPASSMCTITSPASTTTCADIDIVFNLTSTAVTADLSFSYSTNAGSTYAAATAAPTSPLSNPALGVAPGTGLVFIWRSSVDLPPGSFSIVFQIDPNPGTPCTTTFLALAPCPMPMTPSPGDFLISEVMQNPAAVTDALGEWFEIRNVSGLTLDLDGCFLVDLGTDFHNINNGGPLLMPPSGTLVFGVNDNPVTNGNVVVDYQFGGFVLGNADDEIIILDPSMVELVRIEYNDGLTFPDPTGATMNLDPTVTTVAQARMGASWCEATIAWSGADLGSPNASNETCGLGTLPPACVITQPMLYSCQSGMVNINFSSSDADSTTIDVTLRYSTNRGITFFNATPALTSPPPFQVNPALAVPPAAGQVFIWNSTLDLPAANRFVRFQIEVSDGINTTFCEAEFFVVNSPGPAPTCSITSPAGGTVPAGPIPVVFDLVDADSPDLLVTFAFSTNGGITFTPCCVHASSPAPFDSNPAVSAPGTGKTFVWSSTCDLVTTGVVTIRVTVSDCTSASNDTTTFTVGMSLAAPPTPGQVIISEIHADPHPTTGDANGDTVVSVTDDEFVELVNITGVSLDLSGLELVDGFGVRHVFPAGTIVATGRAIVVFAGGVPTGTFGGNIVQVASTGALGLNNIGDLVILRIAGGSNIDLYAFGPEGGMDTAVVNSPEPTSMPMSAGGRPMVLHTVPTPGRFFSPGTRNNGSTPSW